MALWRSGGRHSVSAALCWVISTQTTSFAYDRFCVCSQLSIQPLDRLPDPSALPPPPVFTVWSHTGQIGTEQSVEQKGRGPIAEESGPCSLSVYSVSSLNFHLCLLLTSVSPTLRSVSRCTTRHSSKGQGRGIVIEKWGKQSELVRKKKSS